MAEVSVAVQFAVSRLKQIMIKFACVRMTWRAWIKATILNIFIVTRDCVDFCVKTCLRKMGNYHQSWSILASFILAAHCFEFPVMIWFPASRFLAVYYILPAFHLCSCSPLWFWFDLVVVPSGLLPLPDFGAPALSCLWPTVYIHWSISSYSLPDCFCSHSQIMSSPDILIDCSGPWVPGPVRPVS